MANNNDHLAGSRVSATVDLQASGCLPRELYGNIFRNNALAKLISKSFEIDPADCREITIHS